MNFKNTTVRNRRNSRRAMVAALVAAANVAIAAISARADEQNLVFLDFEAQSTFTAAPNTSGLNNIDPVFLYTYSGLDSHFTRTEGIDTDGVGGSHAAFQSFDGTNSAADFFYYIGIGRYVYIDPAVGGAFSTPDQLKWTFDAKGIGQIDSPPQVTARFALQNGVGDDYVAIKPLVITSDYTSQGGTLDSFFEQDSDPDGGGPLPAGAGTFSGKYGFIAQLDYGNGGFGFDSGNKLSLDNFNISVIRPVYKGAAASNYTDGTNWSEGAVPNSTTAFPQFGANNAVARTVTLNSAVTINRMDFAGTIDDTTTIGGTGSITLQGDSPGLFDHEGNDSTQTINVPVILAKSGTIRVNAGNGTLNLAGGVGGVGNIDKDRNGRLLVKNIRAGGSLNIIGGIVELQNGIANNPVATNSTTVLTDLTISTTADSADLRLNDARLIVDYTGTSPFSKVVASVVAGDITGGVTADPKTAVAVVERSQLDPGANTFGGIAVDSTSVLALLTLKGDANVDRVVNFNDLVRLAQNYNLQAGATWAQGDSNYDGKVNFDDLVPLAQNYNGTFTGPALLALGDEFGPAFAADWALAQSLVPEPASLAALGIGTALLSTRRRIRSS